MRSYGNLSCREDGFRCLVAYDTGIEIVGLNCGGVRLKKLLDKPNIGQYIDATIGTTGGALPNGVGGCYGRVG